MKHKFIVPVMAIATLATVGTLWASSAQVKAADGQASVVEKLAEKLGIENEKVQTAYDEVRQERRTEMQAAKDAKLDEAVKDGVITESQKTALIEKRNEMRQQMSKQREEMQKWMDEQGIDHDKLREYQAGGFGRGGMHKGVMGPGASL